jgi:hypothetical protein
VEEWRVEGWWRCGGGIVGQRYVLHAEEQLLAFKLCSSYMHALLLLYCAKDERRRVAGEVGIMYGIMGWGSDETAAELIIIGWQSRRVEAWLLKRQSTGFRPVKVIHSSTFIICRTPVKCRTS